MFFRIKKIKGKEYAYKVKNKWINGSSRQKVVGYIGRIYRLQRKRDLLFEDFVKNVLKKDYEKYLQNLDFDEAIMDLARYEFYRNGAELKNQNEAAFNELSIAISKNSITSGGKDIALKINDGFLCNATLKEIFETGLREEEQEAGLDFAHKLVNAGLDVPKEVFVRLYDKLS